MKGPNDNSSGKVHENTEQERYIYHCDPQKWIDVSRPGVMQPTKEAFSRMKSISFQGNESCYRANAVPFDYKVKVRNHSNEETQQNLVHQCVVDSGVQNPCMNLDRETVYARMVNPQYMLSNLELEYFHTAPFTSRYSKAWYKEWKLNDRQFWPKY